LKSFSALDIAQQCTNALTTKLVKKLLESERQKGTKKGRLNEQLFLPGTSHTILFTRDEMKCFHGILLTTSSLIYFPWRDQVLQSYEARRRYERRFPGGCDVCRGKTTIDSEIRALLKFYGDH
jgi:hypothetical protein